MKGFATADSDSANPTPENQQVKHPSDKISGEKMEVRERKGAGPRHGPRGRVLVSWTASPSKTFGGVSSIPPENGSLKVQGSESQQRFANSGLSRQLSQELRRTQSWQTQGKVIQV